MRILGLQKIRDRYKCDATRMAVFTAGPVRELFVERRTAPSGERTEHIKVPVIGECVAKMEAEELEDRDGGVIDQHAYTIWTPSGKILSEMSSRGEDITTHTRAWLDGDVVAEARAHLFQKDPVKSHSSREDGFVQIMKEAQRFREHVIFKEHVKE